MKRKTTYQFIQQSIKINGDIYDYSLVDYINNKTHVDIICKIHGIFSQRPDNHLNQKQQCPKCNNFLTNFIETSNRVHNNLYNYNKVNYINNNTKVIIGCPLHGDFKQNPTLHKKGYNCPKCKSIIKKKPHKGKQHVRKLDKDVINDFNIVHNNKYDYDKMIYINNRIKIIITCFKHGDFKQTPSKHLIGQGCNECGKKISSNKRRTSNKTFTNNANIIHHNLYNYDKVVYITNRIKVIIGCSLHGNFKQIPLKHLSGQGCPKCKSSSGEEKIRKLLTNMNITFYEQKTFDGCEDINKLRFDFHIPSINTLIEFDGQHHFKSIDYFGGMSAYLKQRKRDLIKNKYCRDNSIRLIRIPYYESNIIKNILFNITKC